MENQSLCAMPQWCEHSFEFLYLPGGMEESSCKTGSIGGHGTREINDRDLELSI
jgi:hypothetical protein